MRIGANIFLPAKLLMVFLVSAAMVACHWGSDGSSGSDSSGGTSNPPPPPPPSFTASLDSTSLSVSQGSSAGVWVTLTRTNGFASDVTITLDNPPEGVFAFESTVPGVASDALVNIRVSDDLATGSSENLTLVASGGGITVRLPLALSVSDPQPTSESLIAADLAAGKIDYATSLLYRAYAIFHDARLPAQYVGSADPLNDGFFREAGNPNLPASLQAELAPFLARPTDPASVFQQSAHAAQKLAGRVQANATISDATTPCTLQEGEIELNGWKSVLLTADGAVPIRFWVECSAEQGFDDLMLKLAAETAGKVLGPMTSLMGQPIADKGGDYFGTDNAIDVYLADACAKVPRNDSASLCDKHEKVPSVAGATIDTYKISSNADGNVCSAFVIVDRNELTNNAFKSTFAHEFFHVLEDAYNCNISFSVDTTGVFRSEYWFTEAAATWAEAHFVPETAAQEVHSRFVKDFQNSTDSLHTSIPTHIEHIYAAYIWPYFYEQHFGAASMQSAWQSLRTAEDFNQGNKQLDGVYDFKTNFRDFAVENLNFDLPDVLSEDKRYMSVFRNYPFPDGKKPRIGSVELSSAQTQTITFDIEALSADYTRVFVTSDKVKQVTFKFDNIPNRDGLDIDAVLKIAGKPWEKRSYDKDKEIRFCLDKPDEDLVDMYLVLSNHNVPLDQSRDGLVKVEASDVVCKQKWVGTATSEFGYTMHANVTWELDETESTETLAVFHPTGNVDFTAPGCTVTPNNADIQPAEGTLAIDYSTDPATYEVQGATVWPGTYQCGDGGSLEAGAGGMWIGDATSATLRASGTVSAAGSNGKKTIGGHNSGNGYTFTWQFSEL